MIKRLAVFVLFIVQTTVAMKTTDQYFCHTCQAIFNDAKNVKVRLYCSHGAQKLLNSHPDSRSLREEYNSHVLCSACIRHVLEGKKVVCLACSDCREITLDEAYDLDVVSWSEYCGFYIKKFGVLAWKKILQAKDIMYSLSEEINDNTHPLVIELSGLLN